MTTIVAAAVDGHVVVAADTLTNVYDRPIPGAAQKIHRVKVGDTGEALLAFCGDGGLVNAADAVTLEQEPDLTDEDDIRQWAAAVCHGIDDWAKERGILEDGRTAGSILLAWRGRLWTLSNSGAIPHPDGRAALGSGEGPALGALDALLDNEATAGIELAEAVVRACRIGIDRDRYSAEPIRVECLRPGDVQPPPGDVDIEGPG